MQPRAYKREEDCLLGYNYFNILVLPGRWCLQNLILRPIYQESFLVFWSRFVRVQIQSLKKLYINLIEKIVSSKKQYGYQKTQKKRKTYYINVFLNPILHLSPVWYAPFCQKKSKSLYTTVLYIICIDKQSRTHHYASSTRLAATKLRIYVSF